MVCGCEFFGDFYDFVSVKNSLDEMRFISVDKTIFIVIAGDKVRVCEF